MYKGAGRFYLQHRGLAKSLQSTKDPAPKKRKKKGSKPRAKPLMVTCEHCGCKVEKGRFTAHLIASHQTKLAEHFPKLGSARIVKVDSNKGLTVPQSNYAVGRENTGEGQTAKQQDVQSRTQVKADTSVTSHSVPQVENLKVVRPFSSSTPFNGIRLIPLRKKD
jgi:hypothetical protein